jgi:hypothetical protein
MSVEQEKSHDQREFLRPKKRKKTTFEDGGFYGKAPKPAFRFEWGFDATCTVCYCMLLYATEIELLS